MSNEILNGGFFSDKDIPASTKLMVALSLSGASFSVLNNATETTCEFVVPSKASPRQGQRVYVVPGNPDSLSRNACSTILRGVGFDQELSEKVLGSSTADKATIEAVRDFYRILEDTNKLSAPDFYEKRIENKIFILSKVLKEKDPYFAQNPMILENLVKTIKESYGSTKVNSLQEGPDSEESQKKK